MEKKTNLKKIALMGITGGILMAQAQANAAQQNGNFYNGSQYYTADESNSRGESSSAVSEASFLSQLSQESKAVYQNLSREGKELALKLANQSCKGKNDCKGQNSCKTNENACAGEGGCKGQSQGPFTDKNVAVNVASMNMAKKRIMMINSGNS